MRQPSPQSRGFTLIEMMVGVGVTSIILVAVAGAFIAAQAAFQSSSEIKTAVEGGRNSLVFLERSLRMAGYGLEPSQAFDFGVATNGVGKDNVALGAGVVTDDLAYRYRDPAYLRRGSFSGGTVTLDSGTFGADLAAGQVVIVACATGGLYAAGRLNSATAASANTAAITLLGAPFPTTVPPCVAAVGGHVMLVHEYRVRVVDLGGRPWLVGFRDLRADVAVLTGTNYDPIASDVEAFQVSYQMNRPPPAGGCCSATAAPDAAGNANWVLGDDAADPLPSTGSTAPLLADPYDSAARYSAHPANIRGVRLSMMLRSTRADPTGRRATGRLPLENFTPVVVPVDGFYRTDMTTAVRVPNLLSRTFFVPSLRSATDTNDLNYWGG